jgi:ribosomal protein L7/L12
MEFEIVGDGGVPFTSAPRGLTEDEEMEVILASDRVSAIRKFRELTMCTLRAAVDFVDGLKIDWDS